ncbi:hypothetical protein IFM89_024173 [Coptis chinensis]|uniref:Uncharacterized protein n=1 Tax=Coptis chinensis TaxID=261450 RepID=A0A835H4X6_9MAGN|nr:hypothetical protein IFM89_024173 [Coptis chinensis]
MTKKRKSVATRLDEVDRTMYSTFCSAANSLSQLYTQALNQQQLVFEAGERHALEKLYEWILRQQEESSRVTTSDIFSYLQNELDYDAFLDCVDTKTLEVDVKISDISYRFTENGKSCDDFECLMWLGLSKSLQRMIGLHASVKDEFLSVQLALKTRGGELHLDEESFDSLLYLVACVRQMKNDLKQQVKGFCMKIDFCRMVYEGTNVCHKLDAFYEKQGELVNELASDFNFCRNYSNYNPEVGKAFNMLIEELELEGLGTQLGRMMQQKGSSNR